MPDLLAQLTIEAKIKFTELTDICLKQGVRIFPYCTLRTCSEQARIYRKTRTNKEIEAKIQSLKDRGLDFLAQELIKVGPQAGTIGAHLTKAGPGESWHQFGEAIDAAPLVDGKLQWDESAIEWEIYGAAAAYVGLTWSGNWKSFKELPHVQVSNLSSPLTQIKDPKLIKDRLLQVNSIT